MATEKYLEDIKRRREEYLQRRERERNKKGGR